MSASESSAGLLAPGLIHTLLDELASRFAGSGYQAEITAAREEYFTRSGKVFEDDAEVHEARTVAFLEWYVIERPLASGLPPVIAVLDDARTRSTAMERLQALASLAGSHRSLFDIAHVDGNVIDRDAGIPHRRVVVRRQPARRHRAD